jgi:hypothetical protein
MPALARTVEAIGIKSGWIDGEIITMNIAGRSGLHCPADRVRDQPPGVTRI